MAYNKKPLYYDGKSHSWRGQPHNELPTHNFLKWTKIHPLTSSKRQSCYKLPFPDKIRPTGDEYEALTSRFHPIHMQFYMLKIVTSYKPSIIVSFLSGPTRNSFSFIPLIDRSLDDNFMHIKIRVLHNHDTHDLPVYSLNSATYEQFYRNADCDGTPLEQTLSTSPKTPGIFASISLLKSIFLSASRKNIDLYRSLLFFSIAQKPAKVLPPRGRG